MSWLLPLSSFVQELLAKPNHIGASRAYLAQEFSYCCEALFAVAFSDFLDDVGFGDSFPLFFSASAA